MKKKGLLISTIVMVVVLIASLTTATYAWFSADAKTSIKGFAVEVVSNNVVNIGLKATGWTDGTSADQFVSGACTYTQGAGVGAQNAYAFGTWAGNPSLAPQITETDVNWGSQSAAVGFVASHNADPAAATGATALFVPANASTNAFTPVAANGTGASTITGTPVLAHENYNGSNGVTEGNDAEKPADFAYLFLGVQATKKLATDTNKFTIVLQPQGTSSTLGIAAAIHVAYRVKLGSGNWSNWTDTDVYGANTYSTSRSSVAASTLNGDWTTELGAGATHTAGVTTTQTGCGVVSISLSNYSDTSSPAVIDQIEVIIYLAGHDSDCINSAINNTQTKVLMFFEAQEYVAP